MHEALWSRVEAELDARRSPFDDAQLARELRADPAAEAAVRCLLASLARISAARQPLVHRRARAFAGAAALLLCAGAAFLAWRARDAGATEQLASGPTLAIVVQHSVPPPARGARVELEPRRVLAWTIAGEAP